MENLKITKGEFKLYYPPNYGEDVFYISDDEYNGDTILPIAIIPQKGDLTEWENNAKLFTDAINTANKCNLLPSELLEQRDELLGIVKKIINHSKNPERYSLPIVKSMTAIKNIEK